MDALSDILRHVRLTASVFSRAELTSPWAVSTRGTDGGIFHAVLRGGGWIAVDGGQAQAFSSGDLMVLPRGDPHIMSDKPTRRAVALHELSERPGAGGLPTVRQGGAGPATSLLCGSFQVAEDSLEYVMPLLPPLLHVKAATAPGAAGTASWLSQTLDMLTSEVRGALPGTEVIRDRLADILAVQVLRVIIAEAPASAVGWLAGMRDPAVAKTLDSIHAAPAHSWTAARLARSAGLSRAGLFRKFAATVGETPTAYLTRWRMHLARIALSREGVTVAELAERVGYASEAAFTRAFRRHVGVTPAAFRKGERAPSS